MQTEWFYAEDQKAIGPVTLDTLIAFLRTTATPGELEVWHSGFAQWKYARNVPELADSMLVPLRVTPNTSAMPAVGHASGKRRWIAVLIVLLAIIAGGAILSTLIYENSAGGIASLAGELTGAAAVVALLSIPWRKKPYAPAVVLAIAALSVGIGNSKRLVESSEMKRARAALTTVSDRTQPEQALQRDPSNSILKLTVEAYRIALETAQLTDKLSEDIEPAALAGDFDIPNADRGALESYQAALRTAERNTESAMRQYLSLLQDERSKIEQYARSLNVSEGVTRGLLAGVDGKHAVTRDVTARMMDARRDVYRATSDLVSVLIAETGNYKVDSNGQISFQNPAAVARYDTAAKAVASAVARIESVDAERQERMRKQQETWGRWMSGQKVGSN